MSRMCKICVSRFCCYFGIRESEKHSDKSFRGFLHIRR